MNVSICQNRLAAAGDNTALAALGDFPFGLAGFDALRPDDVNASDGDGRRTWRFTTDDLPAIPLVTALAEAHPDLAFDLLFSRDDTMAGWSSFHDGILAERHEAFTPEAARALVEMRGDPTTI